MRRLALYGKGGIGKSTIAANLSAVFSLQGFKVMQIGCDPKSDSAITLMGGREIPTILDQIRNKGSRGISLDDIVLEGYNGVLAVECGGPTPGVGCAGRGILTAFNKLEELHAFETYKPDIVIYDVLGDVVCGGFAVPIRHGYAQDVMIVTSGEYMSLHAAKNIILAVTSFSERGYARIGGIIQNSRNIEDEDEKVTELALNANFEILQRIPRDPVVQKWEVKGMTVIEKEPDAPFGKAVSELAERILAITTEADALLGTARRPGSIDSTLRAI